MQSLDAIYVRLGLYWVLSNIIRNFRNVCEVKSSVVFSDVYANIRRNICEVRVLLRLFWCYAKARQNVMWEYG